MRLNNTKLVGDIDMTEDYCETDFIYTCTTINS